MRANAKFDRFSLKTARFFLMNYESLWGQLINKDMEGLSHLSTVQRGWSFGEVEVQLQGGVLRVSLSSLYPDAEATELRIQFLKTITFASACATIPLCWVSKYEYDGDVPAYDLLFDGLVGHLDELHGAIKARLST